MKYAKIEAEKKMEVERKRCEMEETQRLRSYESAKAEADAVGKIEEEEKNPNLLDLKQYQIPEDNKDERTQRYISSLSDVSSGEDLIPLPYSFQPVVRDAPLSSSPPQGIQPSSKLCETDPKQRSRR